MSTGHPACPQQGRRVAGLRSPSQGHVPLAELLGLDSCDRLARDTFARVMVFSPSYQIAIYLFY